MTGKFGRQLHEDLLNAIRILAPIYLWKRLEVLRDYVLLVDEYLMMRALGEQAPAGLGHRAKGTRIPDLLFLVDMRPVVVEIGDYVPDKWTDQTVIHVGFDRDVTLIPRGRVGSHVEVIADAVRFALKEFDKNPGVLSDADAQLDIHARGCRVDGPVPFF